jgi:hypothetical protein
MSLQRRQVGETETYHGRRLVVRFCGPDLLSYVDDIELSDFYLNVEVACVKHGAGTWDCIAGDFS